MNEASKNLLHVQEIDSEIVELEQQLKSYPKRIKSLETNAAMAHQKADKATENLRKARANRGLIETEIKQKQEKIKKFLNQQMQVKSNKEFQAINHQVDTLKNEISDQETLALEALVQEEALESELNVVKEAVRHSDREFETENARLTKLETEKREQLKRLKGERKNWISQVPEELVDQYESIFSRYPGNAIVPEFNMSCGGCHMRLLASTMQQLHEGDSLVPCPHCRRFLYPPEAAKEAHVKL